MTIETTPNNKAIVNTTNISCVNCGSEFQRKETENLCPTCTHRKKLYKHGRKLFKLGHRVIAFKIDENGKKVPDIKGKWSQWQYRRQTEKEFEAQNIEKHDLIGVLTGTKLRVDGEDVYFTVVDRDTKDPKISDVIKDKTLDFINKKMPITQRESTMNKGDHLNYYSRILPKSKKLNDIGIELLSKGNLAVVYPSKGYLKVNDNTPTIVTNIEDKFYAGLKELGLYTNSFEPTIKTETVISSCDIRPCYIKLQKKDHLTHEEKVALIYELYLTGKTEQQIVDIFVTNQSWERPPDHSFNRKKTINQIEYTINTTKNGKEFQHRYLKQTLQEKEICYATCEFINCVDCRESKQDLFVTLGKYTLTKKGKKLVLRDENEKVCFIETYHKLLTEKYKQNLITYTNVTDIRIINQKIAELDLKTMEETENREDKETAQTREAVIKQINEKFKVYCDATDLKNLPVYIWTGKKWEEKLLGEIYKTHYQIYGTEEPESSAKSIYEFYQGKGQFTTVLPKPHHLVPFQNGYFNLKTEQLEPLTSEYFSVNVLPCNFIENPKLPKYHKLQKDIHHQNDINFTNEVFAYCLYTTYTRPLFLILVGNGQNGKSVELEVIGDVLGEENISTISLHQLVYNPYGIAEAYQKLAVISDDMTNNKITRVGVIKALSSGSRITGRKIFGSPFDFTNYAKILTSCNEPPEIDDDTDSLYIRLKFIDYPNKFVENPKPGTNERQAKEKNAFVQEILEEKEHIASFLVKKLAELYRNGFKFSYSKSTDEVRDYYRKKSKPVISWLEDCFVYTGKTEDVEKKKEIYQKFKTWCKKNTIKPIPSGTKFFRTLIDEGIGSTQPRSYNRERVYEGYKVVTPSQDKTCIANREDTHNSIVSLLNVIRNDSCDIVSIPYEYHLPKFSCINCDKKAEILVTFPEVKGFLVNDYEFCNSCFTVIKEEFIDQICFVPQNSDPTKKIVYQEDIIFPEGKCSDCKGSNGLLPTIKYGVINDPLHHKVCSICFEKTETKMKEQGFVFKPFPKEGS